MSHNAFQYLRDCLMENNYVKGGGRGIFGFARLVKDDPVGLLHGWGVEAMVEKRGEERTEQVAVNGVHFLLHPVQDRVWARGGAGQRAEEDKGHHFHRNGVEGGVKVAEDHQGWRSRRGNRKKMIDEGGVDLFERGGAWYPREALWGTAISESLSSPDRSEVRFSQEGVPVLHFGLRNSLELRVTGLGGLQPGSHGAAGRAREVVVNAAKVA